MPALTFSLPRSTSLPIRREAPTGVTGSVRRTLQAEGLALFVAAVALFVRADYSVGLFAALFLAPDLSLLGYLAGPRAGAMAYNIAHSTVGPIALAIVATVVLSGALPVALIWLAHVGFDRALGYGLKYASAFGHTHLGNVGHARRG